MAEIIEDLDQVGELETVTQEIENQEVAKEEGVKETVLDSLPEKYRGKKVEDVIKMHQEAEKLASRHAQEVGEIRKLADELIKSQLKKPEVEQPKEVDFFEDPQAAVRNTIANDPRIQAMERQTIVAQQQMALQTLSAKHPDYLEVNQDEDFQNWLKGSRVRQGLYQMAMGYDVDAADELLSTYKQLKQVNRKAVNDVEVKARDNALKAASVDTGGSGETTKKYFSRAQLMNKRVHDPAWIEANQAEISRAYAEGRIKP